MYMRIAEAVAKTSSGVRLKVGAVAVKNNMVIGTGYNALPSGLHGSYEDREYWDVLDDSQNIQDFPLLDENRYSYRLVTKAEVRHAEANLLLNLAKSTESSEGATIFCTHSCCKFCAMDIVDSGVKEVYYLHNYRDSSGIDYLVKNGVKVNKIELGD